MNLTSNQRAAIDASGHSLLVSAAAGSGKTRVLVDRIVKRILDKDLDYSIDELLIMTFTKAAAGEMKERLKKSLEKALSLSKDKQEYKYLKKQVQLVDIAKISTIDSFCMSIVKDNISKIDLDPSFKIADTNDLKLLKKDVMKDFLEEEYELMREDFSFVTEIFTNFRSDINLSSCIENIYNVAMSMPYPEKFLSDMEIEKYPSGVLEEINKEIIEKSIDSIIKKIKKIEEIASSYEEVYTGILYAIGKSGASKGNPTGIFNKENNEKDIFLNLDYKNLSNEEIKRTLDKLVFARFPSPKNVDLDIKNIIKAIRDEYKEEIKDLAYNLSLKKEDLNKQEEFSIRLSKVLVRLTREYTNRLKAKKLEKSILDFNDVAHYALEILYKNNIKTDIAKEYAKEIKEIYIDEYQDSSFIQEKLVESIENNNVFMVGDVKQSIYRFRQAKPELFVKKYDEYNTYSESEKDFLPKKILLSDNFRSRKIVLDTVNAMFYKLMRKDVGDVAYTNDVALKYGANFYEDETTAKKTLFTYINEDSEKVDEDLKIHELEAKLLARTIKDLLSSNLRVKDGISGEYRKAEYKDIVILLKKVKDIGNIIVKELTRVGIPCFVSTRTGFFDTFEIRKFMAFLSCIDNRSLELPMLAYLKSPIIKITDKEISSLLVTFNEKKSINEIIEKINLIYYADDKYLEKIYEFARDEDFEGFDGTYQNEVEEKEAFIKFKKENILKDREKLENSLSVMSLEKIKKAVYYLNKYENESKFEPVHKLIRNIFEETLFLEYVSAMKNGETRRANLLLLLEKAKSFEQGVYSGLFNFIRYIDDLKKSDSDFGEASTISENSNTVKIMTMHSSKGLQFPICILAGLSTQFLTDKSKILIDDDAQLAFEYLDSKYRTTEKSFKKRLLESKNKKANIGEELRLLYVAMTRAEELLVISSSKDFMKKKSDIKYNLASSDEEFLDVDKILSASSQLDFFALTSKYLDKYIEYKPYTYEDIELESKDIDVVEDEKEKFNVNFDELDEILGFEYKNKDILNLKNKLSVSELKKKENSLDKYVNKEENDDKFISVGKQELDLRNKNSLVRGNVYHKFFELLDFEKIEEYSSISEYMKSFEKIEALSFSKKPLFSGEEISLVKEKDIRNFIFSDLGKRMKEASKKGKLYREKEFYMGLSAKELEISNSEEIILVQGIIDAYVDEDDGFVVIDYKTDKVKKEEDLKQRYYEQLEYYAKALEKSYGKKVKEKIIWSVELGKEIKL